jgi:hypothetical protein
MGAIIKIPKVGRMHINMELQDDKNVGVEEFIWHVAIIAFNKTMARLELYFELPNQVGSQKSKHMTTNEQLILRRSTRAKGALIKLMHYACVAIFYEPITLTKVLQKKMGNVGKKQ